jgi:methyl-accepting chemotaxis protein
MGFFANMNIGKRLGVGFTLVLALTVLITVAGIWRMNTTADATRTMMAVPLAKERLMAEWHTQTFGAVRRTAAIVKSTDPSLVEFFKEDAKTTSGRSTELIKQIEPLLTGEQERAVFARIGQLRKAYTDAKDKAVKARADGNAEESARILTQEYMPASKAYEQELAHLVSMQEAQIDTTARDIDQANGTSTRLMALGAIVAVLFGAACSWMLTRGIVRPIRDAVTVAETVASGDLTHAIEARSQDETGALLRALRHMNDSLVGIVSQVRGGTDTIATASREISAGNLDLSARTEQQASAIEETAATMEELTTTVKQNADNARQANQLAIAASEVASQGGAVVGEVVTTMGAINASASKIADIIGVIDGIAFQTNILALNAAVEAARAGEQGRGFAVVASEVRNLAQRSAAAAKEIKELITASAANVEAGTKLVDQAGNTMEQVVTSIRRVTDIMAEITSASQEQSGGIEQVNQAIGQMDQVTQQNAALVEEAAAAAGSMQDQAAKLADVVSVFRLDREHQVAVPSAPAAPVVRAAPARPAVARPAAPAPKAIAAAPLKPAAAKRKEPVVADGGDWEEF